MNNKPLVSVITSIYNHENYIQDAIKSIINQTYQNIEFIIIDDGSKDNSFAKALELKDECEKRFTRIIMETKENEGTKKTYNKLLSLVNGKYVFRLDSDDLAKPEVIEKEVEVLESNPNYVLAVGDNDVIDENGIIQEGKTAKELITNARKIDLNSDDFGDYSILALVSNHVPNGYLIRKETLDKCRKFIDEAPLEDWWLMLQLSKYGKFKFIDEVLFSYRWHQKNTSADSKHMRKMARQTVAYELKTLKDADFSKMLPVVRKTYLKYKHFGKLAKFAKKLELRLKFKKVAN